MKSKWLYIFGLILLGAFAIFLPQAKTHKSSPRQNSGITVSNPSHNSSRQSTGDSPFIRFHHGIGESGVSVAAQNDFIISLNPVNSTPEKFAGIMEYVSSLSCILPVTREFLYSTPLRSPPIFS